MLRKLADEEEALRLQFSAHAIIAFARVLNRNKFEKFDPASRPLPWTGNSGWQAFVCDVPPDRGTITLSHDGLWWLPAIERPQHLKCDGPRFASLPEAMDWVERTIPKLRAEDDQQTRAREREAAEEQARVAGLPRMDLAAYWIEPSALEPERLTYRAIVELGYEPYSYKKIEISFGEHWRTDEEFYTPSMIANELRFPPSHVAVTQASRYAGLYVIRSVTIHYDSQRAADRAQQLWEQSAILEKYKVHQVIRARYGVEEVETQYRQWLGGIEPPGDPWPPATSRADYLKDLAMKQTLLHALDVNGYRQHLCISSKYVSDEKLLESIHQVRAESPFLPDAVRAKSRQWLSEHQAK